jgi:hypothetical protein
VSSFIDYDTIEDVRTDARACFPDATKLVARITRNHAGGDVHMEVWHGRRAKVYGQDKLASWAATV